MTAVHSTALAATIALGALCGPAWPGGTPAIDGGSFATRPAESAVPSPQTSPGSLTADRQRTEDPGGPPAGNSLRFIDTRFENASPAWYDFAPDGTVRVHLLYDHERAAPNRAAGHIHLLLNAVPGSRFTLEFLELDNVWNGRPGSVARELKTLVISENGRDWRPVATRALPTNRVQLDVHMPGPKLYVARVEPYRLSDLDRFLESIRKHPRVEIAPIGPTVQGRELEIVRVGNPQAPHRVFVRARAHPWESGGNWVVEGFVGRLIEGDAAAEWCLDRYCAYILPLANKDGVAGGMTRFNVLGKDLNRNWDLPADPELAPENAALERWLESRIQAGQRPDLALDLHNDGGGQLHVSRPAVPGLPAHLARMARLEELLRRHTWFTEGSTTAAFRNPGSLGDGWLERFGIDAAVHEFNCNWIAGLEDYPTARHWREYGAKLAIVLSEYFGGAAPVPPDKAAPVAAEPVAGVNAADDDAIATAPESALGETSSGLVCLSVASGREQPEHQAEMGTQELMGYPLRVLRRSGMWYLVQTSDRYASWMEDGAFRLCTAADVEAWNGSTLLMVTAFDDRVLERPEADAQPVTDVVMGGLVRKIGEADDWYRVELPDRRTGFLPKTAAQDYAAWRQSHHATPEAIERTARSLLGRPYLWGGNSTKAFDCSGFTKFVFFLNGISLERNARQQARQGVEVPLDPGLTHLKKGDLLFFGRRGVDGGPGRVVHTGIYLGDRLFIHSSERVRINSLDPASPLRDEYRIRTLLSARRLLPVGG